MMSGGSMVESWQTQLWIGQLSLGQISAAVSEMPQQVTPVFVNPQIFVALVAGLLMAFAFQLLLTNLGIAIGVTALGFQISRRSTAQAEDADADQNDDQSAVSSSNFGSTVRTIGFAAGSGILLTINVVLFAACYLAAKLSLVSSPFVGAILGVVIWSAYFLILIWVSSTAVSSIASLVFGTAAAGFRSIISTISAVLKGKEPEATYLTEATAAKTIRQEVQAALNSGEVQDSLKEYLVSLQPPSLDLTTVRQELEALLKRPEAEVLAGSKFLNQVNRQTFVDLIRDRTDFSKRDAEQLVEQLDHLWQEALTPPQWQRTQNLLSFLKSASPDELRFDQLPGKLQALLRDEDQDPWVTDPDLMTHNGASPNQTAASLPIDFKAVKQAVLSRIDLSELDVATIWQQLQQAIAPFTPSPDASPSAATSLNTIRTDAEAFLLRAYLWELQGKAIAPKFREVIYDPEAAPDQVQQQLSQIQPADFAEMLHQRQDLSDRQISKIVDRLEAVRQEVLAIVTAAVSQADLQDLRERLEQQLQEVEPDLEKITPKMLQASFKTLIKNSYPSSTAACDRLSQFDRPTLTQLLPPSTQQAEQLDWLEQERDRLLEEIHQQQQQSEAIAADLWQKLESYFRYTKTKRLTPDKVERKLQALLAEVQDQREELLLPALDRSALEKLLKRRKGLDQEQVQQILAQVEIVWQRFSAPPPRAESPTPSAVPTQAEQAIETLTHYLEKVDWSNLNLPDGQQKLMQWLGEMGMGSWGLKQLAEVDWQTLSEKLQQRQDLSVAQVQQMVYQMREIGQQWVKTPRRWATRSKMAAWNFFDRLQDYLRHSDKSDLMPEGIQANLTQLVQEAEQNGDQPEVLLNSAFDRALLTAILSERADLTEAEAIQAIEQIESVRLHLLDQMQQTQAKLRSRLDHLLGDIRQYVTTLKLPDLNSDSLKQDLYQLLDIPQAGLEAFSQSVGNSVSYSVGSVLESPLKSLQQRLGQFNHDTLVTLLKTRDDLSEAVSSRVIEQVEGMRDQVMQQVEQLQQQAQRQLEDLKQQAQQQAEATRKAAAIAAWWLFCTALSSLTTAAIAGTLAITGIHIGNWSL